MEKAMPYQTATELMSALRAKKVSSAELVDAAIARIEAVDQKLNAVVVRDFDRARGAARAADAARAKGDDRPLLGLPFTVKEVFNIAGLPTTWGLPGTQAIPVTEDAVVVARLKAAGAIILGKTNVSILLQDWQSSNPVYGVTNNPWDVSRTPGGSSGGGAAALAVGLVPLEFGSDLGGSLRIPASFCGIFAHRSSHGLVPLRGFAPPGTPQLSAAPEIDQAALGPMARSASDLMLALDVIAGPDDAEATAYRLLLPPARHQALKDFRVLVLDETPLVPTAKSVRAALGELAKNLETAGCTVSTTSPLFPDMQALGKTFVELLMAFAGADMPENDFRGLADAARTIDPKTNDLQQAGQRAMALSHRDWVQLDRQRVALADQWRRLFAEFDVVLCPAAPTVAFPHANGPFDQRTLSIDGQEVPYSLLPMWCALPAPTGQPVTAMPIGHDAAGLPTGMQIIGPYLEDRTSIAFAGLVEQAFGGFRVPPGF
jgi:amidase